MNSPDSIAVRGSKTIATPITPPPKKNHPPESPQNHPRNEASEVEDRYTAPQLATKLEIKRQTIEERRKKGTLDEIGYRAEQTGRNWFYYPVKKDLTAIDGDNGT